MCSCPLMPRPTATIRSACDRSTACLASLNGASGFWRIVDRVDRDVRRLHRGRGGAAVRHGVGAERADLERDEVRRRAGGLRRRRSACPGTRARVDRPAVLRLQRDDVGDERPVEPRRERRREVARLVGVRQEDQRPATPARSAPASAATYPSAVYCASAGLVDDRHLCRPTRRRAPAQPRRRPDPSTATVIGPPACCAAAMASQLARFSLPSPLLRDDQNHQITLASSRRRC